MYQVSESFSKYLAAGLSVLPVLKNKRPCIPTWDPYQTRFATAEEIAGWGKPEGVAIIAGKISGNLICIDIDEKHDGRKTISKEYFDLLKEWGHGEALEKVAVEKTPSGGYHVLFRASFTRPCEKMARDFGKQEAMIEIKGEGGYFVCDPTPGWEIKKGSLLNIPVLDDDDASAFISAAWALDRTEIPHAEPVERIRHEGKSPFDDYQDRVTAESMEADLIAHGWRRIGQRGENIHLARPGKEGRFTGATLHRGKRIFYPFTSSTEFPSGKGYSGVAVHTILNYGGDFKRCAKALFDQGYGEKQSPVKKFSSLPSGVTVSKENELVSEVMALYHKPFYPGESTGWKELDKIFRIEKGQLNILFGIPSHGKSSFMDALITNLALISKWRTVIFSPENATAAYHTSKICEIVTGKPFYGKGRITEAELKTTSEWVSKMFVFLKQSSGGTSLDEILEKVEEIKPDAVIVDPWNRINHARADGLTETEYIGSVLSRTSAICKSLNLSFWFVVHPQKLRRDKNGDIIRPGFYEVSGSAHWANMADNGILVFRDFANDLTEIETVKVRYRHNGSVGTAKMKFDRSNGRFTALDEGQKFVHGLDSKSLAAGDIL